MKEEKPGESLLRLIATLTAISVISAITLTVAYNLTNPIIQENKIAELRSSLEEVIPAAEKFEEVESLPPGTISKREGVKRVFRAYGEEDRIIGLVILSDATGYNDFIKILFGLDGEGKITQVKILEHLETPGLGERITGEEFLGQFEGKSSLEGVDAITGATISSQAVIERIKEDTATIVDLINEGKI